MAKKKAPARKTKTKPEPAKRGRPFSAKKKSPIALAKKIEFRDPRKLKPDPNNSRVHSMDQIMEIAESIGKFGFTKPILIDETEMVIAGHGALAAALYKKLEFVPVIVLDHLSSDERRAYVIADNKLAEKSAWDHDVLKRELAALDLNDFDLDVLGFSDSELEDLLPDLEGEADEILARDQKEHEEQNQNEADGRKDEPEKTEAEHGDGEESEKREVRGDDETEEIDVERPPDMIIKQPIPPAIAELAKEINFKELSETLELYIKMAETDTDGDFYKKLKDAIDFAMRHFITEEST